MKKKMICLLAALGLTFSACGRDIPAETLAEPTEKGVVLDVVTSYGGDDGNRRNFERAVREFERETGNRVRDRSSVSNEEWKNKVLADFMTGSEPDVLFYFADADANPFINAGRVVSIEEIRSLYPDYGTNIKESVLTTAQDGNHYALPSNGYWESLFVNKKVLEDCGIPLTDATYTWQQFLEDCAVIKSKGYTPIACSLFEIPHYWFEFMVMNNGSVYNHLEIPKVDERGILIMDEAAKKWIAALEDLKTLYMAGYFPKNTLAATDRETVAMFAQGEAAFLLDGSWKVGYFEENFPQQLSDYAVSFVPGKGNRMACEAIGGISMGYFITRKAWDDPLKQEAAVQFVSYLTSDHVLSSFSTTEGTGIAAGNLPAGSNPLQQSAADAFYHVNQMSTAVQDAISSDAKRDLFSNIHKVVTGEMSAKDAVESAMKLN